jgi:flagellar assembly factor FliW
MALTTMTVQLCRQSAVNVCHPVITNTNQRLQQVVQQNDDYTEHAHN